MDPKALYHITYGLYLLSVRSYGQDNACIINTAMQAADAPVRFIITINKANKTHDMIMESGRFNVSALTADAPFSLFERFGMQSGRDVNKFIGFEDVARAKNGLLYLTKYASAYVSAKLIRSVDMGSHTLFIAEVEDAQVTGSGAPCTYEYYQSCIKPKPQKTTKTSWVCKVCGYVHEGEELPDDFICPLCKHGKEDFEKIEA